MNPPGSPARPLRVAIVGSGPAGFYTAQQLFAQNPGTRVDMFDRLPTPFGLVRFGVAPDHPKIKSVTAVYHKLASAPGFRFLGNVDFGRDLRLEDLSAHYDQIVFATGAQTDRRLDIPGEDLRGSHPATDFVAWYNGHPDFSHLQFDLDCPGAVVIGVGNVAVDVARILCRAAEDLASTDIADYALEALSASSIRRVHMVGRRGPAQAAFTNPEIKELGEIAGATARTLADEVEIDPLSRRHMEAEPDKSTTRRLEILRGYAESRETADTSRSLFIRFLLSPVEILGDTAGRVRAVRFARNELYEDERGNLRARTTERSEIVEAGLVFRSVGYRGVALPGLPFSERSGLVPNAAGRVLDPETGEARPGLYVSGWIKRGPTGVIGTNKPDAAETVASMLADLRSGTLLAPARAGEGSIDALLMDRDVDVVSYPDWLRLDGEEIARGKPLGRPRLKFTDRAAFRAALGR